MLSIEANDLTSGNGNGNGNGNDNGSDNGNLISGNAGPSKQILEGSQMAPVVWFRYATLCVCVCMYYACLCENLCVCVCVHVLYMCVLV